MGTATRGAADFAFSRLTRPGGLGTLDVQSRFTVAVRPGGRLPAAASFPKEPAPYKEVNSMKAGNVGNVCRVCLLLVLGGVGLLVAGGGDEAALPAAGPVAGGGVVTLNPGPMER